jgi:alcohol dehydrogenase
MNAVVSRRGPDGFKRSFRDERLVARVAVVDPELLVGVPRGLMAAQGMDAFTQLLESYLSVRANPLSDALAWSGLEAFAWGFWDALDGGDGEGARLGRSRLAYAALVSGITLAQVGLGAVHGLASPLGALHPVPHGVACGTLVAETTRVNLAALRARSPGSAALDRYARVGGLLGGTVGGATAEPADHLVDTLRDWTDRLELPRLSAFGITAADLDRIVADSRGSSMRTNPVALDDSELEEVLRARL